MVTFTCIFYAEQPEYFLELLTDCASLDLPTPEQFELESRYRQAEFEDGFEDLSFFVIGPMGIEAFILAHKIQDKVCYSAAGIEILTKSSNKKIIDVILEGLIDRGKQCGCRGIIINDKAMTTSLSVLGQEIFNRKGSPQLHVSVLQDLSFSEEELFNSLRKRYRSYVNKGRRELSFIYVSAENPDKQKFSDFRAFHKKISGRQTRPGESWDVQFEMIEAGCAELTLGYIEEHGLVSSALFNDYGKTTSYGVAVYERSLFDKPLAHANVFEGMLRAKRRGQDVFNLGVIPPYHSDREKEYNIGKFKKGFCRSLTPFIEWTFNL